MGVWGERQLQASHFSALPVTKINEDEEDVVVDDDDAEEDNWAEKEEDAARDGVPRRRIVCGDSRAGSASPCTGAWRALILLIL